MQGSHFLKGGLEASKTRKSERFGADVYFAYSTVRTATADTVLAKVINCRKRRVRSKRYKAREGVGMR